MSDKMNPFKKWTICFTGSDIPKSKLTLLCNEIGLLLQGPLTNETMILVAKKVTFNHFNHGIQRHSTTFNGIQSTQQLPILINSQLQNIGGCSEKFKAANKLQLPIVTPDWIEKLHSFISSQSTFISSQSNNQNTKERTQRTNTKERTQRTHDGHSDNQNTEYQNTKEYQNTLLQHAIHIMKECLVSGIREWNISTTGFKPNEMPRIITRIQQLGAIYQPALTSSADCLIVKDLTHESPKSNAAKKWGILVHDLDWLFGIETLQSWQILIDKSILDSQLDPCAIPESELLYGQSHHQDHQDQDTNQIENIEISSSFQGGNTQKTIAETQLLQDTTTDQSYLDGFSIFLGDGFTTDLASQLRKLVRQGGGNFMNKCSDFVTHYLIAASTPSSNDMTQITENMNIVSYKWLQECFRVKQAVDVGLFLVAKHGSCGGGGPVQVVEKNKVFKQTNTNVVNPPSSVQAPSEPRDDLKIKSKLMHLIFQGLYFYIDGFKSQEKIVISKAVAANGGCVIDDALLNQPHYHVVPFSKYDVQNENTDDSNKTIVTEFFIEKCMQDTTLHSPSLLIVYKPTEIPLPLTQFTSFVFSSTGFDDSDTLWIERIVQLTGASFTYSFSRKNTHLVVYDDSTTTSGSAKVDKARLWGIEIVSLSWLYECLSKGGSSHNTPRHHQESKIKKEETFALRTSKTKQFLQKATLKTAKVVKEKIQYSLKRNIEKAEEMAILNEQRDDIEPPPIVLQDHLPTSQPPPKQDEYTSLLKATIQETLYAMKHTSSSSSLSSQEQQKKRLKIKEAENSLLDHQDSESSKPEVRGGSGVAYLDSEAKYEQMRLIHSLDPSQPKLFMFSGTSLSDRDVMTKTIDSLGGSSCSHDQTWDSKCTHLLISKVIKTEKFLAACASCCWILKSDYIDACRAASKWIDESLYAVTGHEYVDAALYWKQIYLTTNKKPFSDWNCFLVIEKHRLSGFERLLRAGDATLVSSISEMSKDNASMNMCFYDKWTDEIQQMQSKYSYIKFIDSSRIVDYLLSGGKDRL